tara:strand:+ start:4748 stop:5692 length:945 start_codon:yes stop_codon:yes gene_type:complete
MAAVLTGHGAFIKYAKESTWGVAVSTTISNRINSVSIQKVQERGQKANLSVPASGVLGGLYDGFLRVEGSIEMPVMYQGLGLLFEMALGNLANSGTGPYTNEYTPDLSLPSATLEVQRGTGITNQKERFTGIKISTLAISCEAGGEMTATIDFIGKTSLARSANITSSFGTGTSVLHFHASQLSFDGANYDVRSFTFTVNNNLERRDLLGNKETGEPAVGDVRTITLEATLDIENDALQTAFIAGTQSDVRLEFTSGADRIIFDLTNAIITDHSDPVNAFGRVERTLTFTGLADNANVGGKITCVNSDATGIGN